MNKFAHIEIIITYIKNEKMNLLFKSNRIFLVVLMNLNRYLNF